MENTLTWKILVVRYWWTHASRVALVFETSRRQSCRGEGGTPSHTRNFYHWLYDQIKKIYIYIYIVAVEFEYKWCLITIGKKPAGLSSTEGQRIYHFCFFTSGGDWDHSEKKKIIIIIIVCRNGNKLNVLYTVWWGKVMWKVNFRVQNKWIGYSYYI